MPLQPTGVGLVEALPSTDRRRSPVRNIHADDERVRLGLGSPFSVKSARTGKAPLMRYRSYGLDDRDSETDVEQIDITDAEWTASLAALEPDAEASYGEEDEDVDAALQPSSSPLPSPRVSTRDRSATWAAFWPPDRKGKAVDPAEYGPINPQRLPQIKASRQAALAKASKMNSQRRRSTRRLPSARRNVVARREVSARSMAILTEGFTERVTVDQFPHTGPSSPQPPSVHDVHLDKAHSVSSNGTSGDGTDAIDERVAVRSRSPSSTSTECSTSNEKRFGYDSNDADSEFSTEEESEEDSEDGWSSPLRSKSRHRGQVLMRKSRFADNRRRHDHREAMGSLQRKYDLVRERLEECAEGPVGRTWSSLFPALASRSNTTSGVTAEQVGEAPEQQNAHPEYVSESDTMTSQSVDHDSDTEVIIPGPVNEVESNLNWLDEDEVEGLQQLSNVRSAPSSSPSSERAELAAVDFSVMPETPTKSSPRRHSVDNEHVFIAHTPNDVLTPRADTNPGRPAEVGETETEDELPPAKRLKRSYSPSPGASPLAKGTSLHDDPVMDSVIPPAAHSVRINVHARPDVPSTELGMSSKVRMRYAAAPVRDLREGDTNVRSWIKDVTNKFSRRIKMEPVAKSSIIGHLVGYVSNTVPRRSNHSARPERKRSTGTRHLHRRSPTSLLPRRENHSRLAPAIRGPTSHYRSTTLLMYGRNPHLSVNESFQLSRPLVGYKCAQLTREAAVSKRIVNALLCRYRQCSSVYGGLLDYANQSLPLAHTLPDKDEAAREDSVSVLSIEVEEVDDILNQSDVEMEDVESQKGATNKSMSQKRRRQEETTAEEEAAKDRNNLRNRARQTEELTYYYEHRKYYEASKKEYKSTRPAQRRMEERAAVNRALEGLGSAFQEQWEALVAQWEVEAAVIPPPEPATLDLTAVSVNALATQSENQPVSSAAVTGPVVAVTAAEPRNRTRFVPQRANPNRSNLQRLSRDRERSDRLQRATRAARATRFRSATHHDVVDDVQRTARAHPSMADHVEESVEAALILTPAEQLSTILEVEVDADTVPELDIERDSTPIDEETVASVAASNPPTPPPAVSLMESEAHRLSSPPSQVGEFTFGSTPQASTSQAGPSLYERRRTRHRSQPLEVTFGERESTARLASLQVLGSGQHPLSPPPNYDEFRRAATEEPLVIPHRVVRPPRPVTPVRSPSPPDYIPLDYNRRSPPPPPPYHAHTDAERVEPLAYLADPIGVYNELYRPDGQRRPAVRHNRQPVTGPSGTARPVEGIFARDEIDAEEGYAGPGAWPTHNAGQNNQQVVNDQWQHFRRDEEMEAVAQVERFTEEQQETDQSTGGILDAVTSAVHRVFSWL